MGGATLPTANTPGYTTFRGRVTCVCLAQWLPVFERLLLAAGEIRYSIDVVQLTGGAAASGGTHTQGGAFDVKQRTANAIRLGREMGAPAFWARTGPAWAGNEHAHGVLLGCPHNSPAAYQIAAQRAGYDGLGRATTGRYAGMWGYGGRDPHPGPDTYRTWEQGIAWAKTEIARLTKPTPAPAAPEKDDIMAMTPAERAQLVKEIAQATANEVLWAPTLPGQKGTLGASSVRNNIGQGAAFAQQTLTVVRALAAKSGVDIDEKAIADAVVAGLAPTVRQAVIDAGQPATVADAVVAKLGAALNPPAA